MQPRQPGCCTESRSALHLVARRSAHAAVVSEPAFDDAQPDADARLHLAGELRVQRRDLGLRFIDIALARQEAGALGADARRLDRVARLGERSIEPRQQARRRRLHAASRCSASRSSSALRYGRDVVMAEKASATERIRAISGIDSAPSPSR